MKNFWIINVLLTLIFPIAGFSGSISDLLIMQDIGQYKFMGKGGGNGSGVIIAADHFNKDHVDESYSCLYFNDSLETGINVEITIHSGGDSDKWLGHEVDRAFRNYYGVPGDSFAVRVIDGNTIIAAGSGGWDYRWLSGCKVIHIEYTDLEMIKPEPLEVVQAYLVKHPSTLTQTTSTALRTDSSKVGWIKDEMERRLWLGDKWFAQIQTIDPKLRDKLKSVTNSMIVFINYREKYYSVIAKNEKIEIETALSQNNVAAIQTKLTAFKTWWAEHKGDSITL